MSTAAPDDLQRKQPERSLGELIGTMTEDVSTLVRKEVELAKAEISEEMGKARTAAIGFAGAAIAGLYAGFAFVLAIGWLLAEATEPWVGFLVVAVVLGIVAALLAKRAQQEVQGIDLAPEQTIETMKENAQWLSEQKS